MADEYKPAGDPMGVWNHPMHDLQTRLEICAGAVEHQAAIAANMRRQRNDLRALLEHWAHIGHLQTFEDRERFRKAARDLLDNPLGASGVSLADYQSESHQTPIPSPMDYEGEG